MKKIKKMIKYYDINKLLTIPITSANQLISTSSIIGTNSNITQVSPVIQIDKTGPNHEDIELTNYENKHKYENKYKYFIDKLFEHLNTYPKEFLNKFFKCVNYNNNSINIGLPINEIDYVFNKSYKCYLSSDNFVNRYLILHFNKFIGNKIKYPNEPLDGNYAIFNEGKFVPPDHIRYDIKNNYLHYFYRTDRVGPGLFEYMNDSNIYTYSPYANIISTAWSPLGTVINFGYVNYFIENYKENVSFYNIIVESLFNKLGIEGSGIHLKCNDETMNYFFDKLEDLIVDKQLINLEEGLEIVKLSTLNDFEIEFMKQQEELTKKVTRVEWKVPSI